MCHDPRMRSINVIGAGRVGRTLAKLWHENATFAVQDVAAATPEGARSAVEFIGSGAPVVSLEDMRAADVWMIATPDRAITGVGGRLAAADRLRAGDIVFHCSGSMPSSELAAVAKRGAHAASIHPLKTFADPRDAAQTFAGTYCAAEGDAAAIAVLRPAFERVGGRIALIDPQLKTVYHAASVIVCNYLTALMEAGLRCYEKAGAERDTAAAMMEPLVRETLDNVFRLGTAGALTGPIARADDSVVARHLQALDAWDERIAAIYRELGVVALDLARAKGEGDAEALARIEAMLKRRQ